MAAPVADRQHAVEYEAYACEKALLTKPTTPLSAPTLRKHLFYILFRRTFLGKPSFLCITDFSAASSDTYRLGTKSNNIHACVALPIVDGLPVMDSSTKWSV
jgi:hypothetical protein